MENLTVQIGIHDGRLVQENSIEIDETIILKLKKFANEKSLTFASQIDNIDDAMFHYSECEELEKELNYIISNIEDNSLKIASKSILVLVQDCIQKKTKE